MQWHRSTHQHHHTWGSLVNVVRLHEAGHLPSIRRPENEFIRVPHSEGRGYLRETLIGQEAIYRSTNSIGVLTSKRTSMIVMYTGMK